MSIRESVEIIRCTVPGGTAASSPTSIEKLECALRERVRRVRVTVANTPHDLDDVVRRRPDVVWNRARAYLDPHVSAFTARLEEVGVTFVGSTDRTITLARDKARSKKAIAAAGLRTAPYFCTEPGRYASIGELPLDFPLFIKPIAAETGAGIGEDSVARDFAEYEAKIVSVHHSFGTDALVEEYLPGREFTVSVFEAVGSRSLDSVPIEIIAEQTNRRDRVLGAKAKAAGTTRLRPVSDPRLTARLSRLATGAFRALGARDCARIDIRLDRNGRCCFLEANVMPGLAPDSYLPRSCRDVQGMDYTAVMIKLLEPALARSRERRTGSTTPLARGTP